MSTTVNQNNFNILSKAQYDAQSTHANTEIWAVEQQDASTSSKGVVQLASTAEASAMSVDTKALTPASIATLMATKASTSAVTSAISTHNTDASAHSTLFAGKQNARTTVSDTTSTSITLANALAGYDYNYGTLTSLTVTANETSYIETTIKFTADSTSITVTLPATLTQIGSPVSFTAGNTYIMSIWNNYLLVAEI